MHWEEITALLYKAMDSRVPKLTLQKLWTEDDIKDFLSSFETVAAQQGWPQDV